MQRSQLQLCETNAAERFENYDSPGRDLTLQHKLQGPKRRPLVSQTPKTRKCQNIKTIQRLTSANKELQNQGAVQRSRAHWAQQGVVGCSMGCNRVQWGAVGCNPVLFGWDGVHWVAVWVQWGAMGCSEVQRRALGGSGVQGAAMQRDVVECNWVQWGAVAPDAPLF